MQITTGIRSVLNFPWVYDLFQDLMGADRIRKEFVQLSIRPEQNYRILDIGCGTARILDYLSDVVYFGFDLSEAYIKDANRRYGARGEFKCAMVEEAVIRDMQAFDIVLAIGLLHHLDDQQAINLFILAQSALKQGGRLITIDPCYAPDQTAIARFLVRRDRGQNVRTAQQYKHLVETIFSQCKFEVKHRQWIPYTHCIMECKK